MKNTQKEAQKRGVVHFIVSPVSSSAEMGCGWEVLCDEEGGTGSGCLCPFLCPQSGTDQLAAAFQVCQQDFANAPRGLGAWKCLGILC